MFRLHIDIPVGTDQAEATDTANQLMNHILNAVQAYKDIMGGEYEVGYKLCCDGERSGRNYLMIRPENDCPANKKCKTQI